MAKLAPELAGLFPNVSNDNHQVTSKRTPAYNCIAWAAGMDNVWWDPAPGYTWPDSATRDYTYAALVSAYEAIGFVQCDNENVEPSFEKIALYGSAGSWTHAARQLPTGKWTSKLGRAEDIEHSCPADLCGAEYGVVICVMRRQLS